MAADDFTKIKRATKLSAYVRRHGGVELHEEGEGRFRSSCPIHGGDNESAFAIDDEKGYWTCFKKGAGCGSGSIIDFWIKTKYGPEAEVRTHLNEAKESLAVQLGVQLSHASGVSETEVYKALEHLCERSEAALDDSDEAFGYIEDRGFTEDDLSEHRIGYFPASGTVLSWLSKSQREALRAAKLVGTAKDSDRDYFLLARRISFPFIASDGRIIGFSGRAFNDEKRVRERKYVNSPNSTVFSKRQVFHGDHLLTRDGLTVVLVEGQTDMVAINRLFREHGMDSHVAIATGGTALGAQKLGKLTKARHVVLLFDGDEAGLTAMLKVFIEVVNRLGSSLTAIGLLNDGDPDELVQAGRGQAVLDAIGNAASCVEMAATAQWHLCGEDIDAMNSWVASSAAAMMFLDDKETLYSVAAALQNADPSVYRREVGGSSAKSASAPRGNVRKKARESLVSTNARPMLGWLAQQKRQVREAILAPISDLYDEQILASGYFPFTVKEDLQCAKVLAGCTDVGTMQRFLQDTNDLTGSTVHYAIRQTNAALCAAMMPDMVRHDWLTEAMILRTALSDPNCDQTALFALAVDTASALLRADN